MATTRTFQDMLNEYLPNELLREEMVKRDFLLSKIEKDESWKGGSLIVPFKAAGASSVAFGSLSASDDIAEDKYVRGSVSGHKEVWGSMIFNHRDLMEHDMVSEQNFLKILPQAVDDFMDHMKMVVSVNLLNGAAFAYLTVTYTGVDGVLTVNRPDLFVIGQKVIVTDGVTPYTVYVRAININLKTITVATTRATGGTFDFSAGADLLLTVNQFFQDGASATTAFSSLRGALLSAANGGDAALYGQTKTAYPYLQAINVAGTDITATNLLEKVFMALTTVRQFGRGNPTDVIMSYKNLGSAMQIVESGTGVGKGPFNVVPNSHKTTVYGWTEIEVGSVTKGGLKLIGVQEMFDDLIFIIDWRALKFHSNGFFQKRKSPDGQEYFETRATTGYQYIIDICLFGEMVVIRPSYCGVIYDVAY